MSLLATRALSVRFGRRTVLYPTDFEVAAGEWKAIIGPNGAGKSTLLKAIAGLAPYTGEVRWRGRSVKADSAGFRRELGVFLHEPMLYGALTARENLLLYGKLYGVRLSEKELLHCLDEVGLGLFAHELVGRFSKGMTQRLALARALLHAPRLLLLDEPLSGIDAKGEGDVLDLFERAKKEGVAAIWVTHHWEKAWPVADEVVELYKGEVVGSTRTATQSAQGWRPRHLVDEHLV